MDTSKLRRFAQAARRALQEQVEARLALVLAEDSPSRRERPAAVARLEEEISLHGREQVVERAAYVWFNRFSALRFMDVNRYTRIGTVSPAEGETLPEILAEATRGYMDERMIPVQVRSRVDELLSGQAVSADPQAEAYRLLLVAACNHWHEAMPFLFDRIDDYTEELLPTDLLSTSSILTELREALTAETCADVEVIGWLYQFYISERKDEVFEGFKKNRKAGPAEIPAATQLFTPNWIVRYLVQNSLGRLWLLNRPQSRLAEEMEYYIPAEEPETEFLHIESVEDIKVCDPACGSGHMLTYAFDLLYAMYEEEGYDPTEIPANILSKNLYGIEIDERAGELAAFALTMKAHEKQRRFLQRGVRPNVCVLGNIKLNPEELGPYLDAVGREKFSDDVLLTLRQFEQADNFGSLIRPAAEDVSALLAELEELDFSAEPFLADTHESVLKALVMADYLSPNYSVVVANPPYMGSKNMNAELGRFAGKQFPDSKSDLFAMFIERGFDLAPRFGYSAMVTMQSWMFLSSYEKLREKIFDVSVIKCLAHMANMVMGIAFGTSAVVFKLGGERGARGAYCYVEYGDIGDNNKPVRFPPLNERNRQAAPRGQVDG